jgi:hypothetical protein
MRVRRLVPLVLLLAACATQRPAVNETPDFKVQVQKADAVLDRGTPVPVAEVKYRIRVTNRTPEPVTLKRVDVDSTSTDIFSHLATRNFDRIISPGQTEAVDCWVAALVLQANARKHPPVSIRMTMFLDTPAGLRVESFTRMVKS